MSRSIRRVSTAVARPADEAPVAAGLPAALRRARGGLSQEAAAWAISVDSNAERPVLSQGTISKLENGKQDRISSRVLDLILAFIAGDGVVVDHPADQPGSTDSGIQSVLTASPAAIAESAAALEERLREINTHTDRQVRALDRLHELLGRPEGVQMNEWEYRGIRDLLHAEGIELAPPP